MSVIDNDTLGSLEAALRNAVAEKIQADRKESAARSEATAALNTVNDLQKRIDAKLAKMRDEPEMRGTDWTRKPVKAVE